MCMYNNFIMRRYEANKPLKKKCEDQLRKMPTSCLWHITISARAHMRGLETRNVRALVFNDPYYHGNEATLTFSLTNVMSNKYIFCMPNLSFEPITAFKSSVQSFPGIQSLTFLANYAHARNALQSLCSFYLTRLRCLWQISTLVAC